MEKNIFEKEFKALGTEIYIQIVAPEIEKEKVLLIFDEIENIYKKNELIFSRFNAESELSKLNNNLGFFYKASVDLICVAQEALKYYIRSEKIFDPRILDNLEKIGYKNNFNDNAFSAKEELSINSFTKDLTEELLIELEDNQIKFLSKMDFSGIVKGYITDKVAKFLIKEGWDNFLVDSGGDMYAGGLNKRNEKWGIALEESENENEIVAEISNEGIATSGNTRKFWKIGDKKFHHLINPKSINKFDFDLKSVTVIAETTREADVLAKVLFIMGDKDGREFANRNKIKSIFLKSNKKIFKLNL